MLKTMKRKLGILLMVLPILFLVGFIGVFKVDVQAVSTSMKFDFGNGGSVSGYTQVKAETAYNSYLGYGFNTPSQMKNVSASGSGILSDAVQFLASGMTSNNTFNVDLNNGLYQVKVYLGNTMRTSIAAEGVFQVMNMTGNNAVATFTVPVTDGQLNILATAGKDGYAFTMSGLEITKLSDNATMPPTIWLCGDSTVCDYYPLATSAQCGWGQLLSGYVDSSFYVRNMATSGQYAKGFVNSGQFASVLKYLKKGDYYVISIGINDGNYSNETEYYETVTSMVKQATAKGANVVLVKQQGRATDVTQHPNLTGRWFGATLDRIGTEQSVKVVDLFNIAFAYYKSIGQDATNKLFLSDGLHPNRAGANILARMVADDVKFTTSQTGTTPSANPDSATGVVNNDSLNGRVFMLRNVNSNLYLDVNNATAANATNVQQWGAYGPGPQNTWKAVYANNGYYYLYSQVGDGNTYLLDVDCARPANGTNIQIYQNTYCDAQLYKFKKNADGSYVILTKVSNDKSCVEVKSALTNNGGNVQEWELNGHNCQSWWLEEIGGTASPTPSIAPVPSVTPSPSVAPEPSVVPSPSIVPSPTVMPTPVPSVQKSNVSINTDVNSWDSGYTANFTIENKGNTTVSGWTLKIKKSEFAITGSWNVTVTESGEYYILTSVDWNANIGGNSSISFGFTCNGTYNANYYYELTYNGGSVSSDTPSAAPVISQAPVVSAIPSPSPSPSVEAHKPTIYLAGDSTVQTYRASYYPQQGWGAYLADYFNSDVTVANHAIAGRSSKNFVTQGRLDAILNTIQEGDYLFVQFAINDANYNNEDRYAPVSDGTYQYYIKQYVEGALNKGATPVLVTTTLSLSSYSNGRFVNSYNDYCNAMKQIANQYGIPCIDLNTLMVNHLNAIGYDNAYQYYMISSSDSSTDKTHFTEKGANAVASLVANAIKSLNVPLASYVK